MTPVRLEPVALQSQVKHSTTEPLRSQQGVETPLDKYNATETHQPGVNWSVLNTVIVVFHLLVGHELHSAVRDTEHTRNKTLETKI